MPIRPQDARLGRGHVYLRPTGQRRPLRFEMLEARQLLTASGLYSDLALEDPVEAAVSGPAPAEGSALGLELLVGFEGPAFTGLAPPDPIAAAGPSTLVAMVNSRIAIYAKDGEQLEAADFLGSAHEAGFFFQEVSHEGFGRLAFDPWIIYDRDAGRFAAIALELDEFEQNARLLFAISTNDSPDDLDVGLRDRDDDWEVRALPFTLTDEQGVKRWGDYPKLAADRDYFYITANYYPFTQEEDVRVWITRLEKAALYAGGAAQRIDISIPLEEFAASLFPAQMIEVPADEPQLFVELDIDAAGRGNGLWIWSIDEAGHPRREAVATEPYELFLDGAPQAGTIATLDTSGERIVSAVWRDGSLWTAHTVAVEGVATVRWYQIATTGGEYELIQQGDVPAAAGVHTFMPALAVDGQGNMGLTYTQSAADQPATMMVAGRRATDPPGVVREGVVARAGVGGYHVLDPPDPEHPERWGDYAGLAVDPVDDTTFWALHEYAHTTGAWGTWWQAFRVAPRIEGDVDGDGQVRLEDFLILKENFGQSGGRSEGDLDGDGQIRLADFLILKANFGRPAETAVRQSSSAPAWQATDLAMAAIGLAHDAASEQNRGSRRLNLLANRRACIPMQ